MPVGFNVRRILMTAMPSAKLMSAVQLYTLVPIINGDSCGFTVQGWSHNYLPYPVVVLPNREELY